MLSLSPEQAVDRLSESMTYDMSSFHGSYPLVYDKVKRWLDRFCFLEDESVLNELLLFYLLATKKHLDHRTPIHLFRMVLSIYFLKRELQHCIAFSPQMRHLKIRWSPTHLFFPFSSKAVLGCLVGYNAMDRYEVFDEENISLALEKHFPQLRMVKESFYGHASQHKDLKIFYFEIEKRDGSIFSLTERKVLKNTLEEKIKNSIQLLSPAVFMNRNEEEIYKNILILNREIESFEDLPQGYITLDQQLGKEIAFRVILVYVSPYHRFSLKERFFNCSFVSEQILTVRHLDSRPVEAQIFRLLIPRDSSCLRSDGSLDFYSAREKVVACIKSAIGEFRDYNGGILLKQQELFQDFKKDFPEEDTELLAAFFYTLMPLEKRVVLPLTTLSQLYMSFQRARLIKLPQDALFHVHVKRHGRDCYIVVHSDQSTLSEAVTAILQEPDFSDVEMVYHFMDTAE